MHRVGWGAFVALIALSPGCVYDELLAEHIEPGGTVLVTVDAGGKRSSTGLGDATGDDFEVSGYSPFLTFGLVAAEDATGTSPKTALDTADAQVVLPIVPGGRNQLQVYADGSGCVATVGSVTLTVSSDKKKLAGSFQADGTVSGGSASCVLEGTLSEIPVQR